MNDSTDRVVEEELVDGDTIQVGARRFLFRSLPGELLDDAPDLR